MQKSKTRFVANLQIMRFAAAALVLWGHIAHELKTYVGIDGVRGLANFPFDPGIGVDIFFVISGFVMMMTIHKQDINFSTFIRGRIFRVVPMYWICTTLVLIMSVLVPTTVVHKAVDWLQIAASYLFIPWLRQDGHSYPLFSLGWTLNYEMFFYLLLGCTLNVSHARPEILMALVLLFLVVLHVLLPPAWSLAYFLTQPIILEFLFGIVLFKLFDMNFRLRRASGILLCIMGFVWASFTYNVVLPHDFGRVLSQGLAAFMICAGAVATEGRWSRNYIYRRIELAGAASYSLYLTHPFVIRPMRLLSHGLLGRFPLCFAAFIAISAVAVSIVIYLVVEMPITKKLKSLARPSPRILSAT
jgi:exopolysaccharide production protein ExoZ